MSGFFLFVFEREFFVMTSKNISGNLKNVQIKLSVDSDANEMVFLFAVKNPRFS